MSILSTRQDLYDYCRSIFIHHHVEMMSEYYQVDSEVILVQPQGYFGGEPLQTVSLTDWLGAKEIGFAQFYRLYHLKITKVTVEEGVTYYCTQPVTDTVSQFPSSAGLSFHITGRHDPQHDAIVWKSIDGEIVDLHSLEAVVNELNRVNTPLNRNQIAHITGDVRERLYLTVNDCLPIPYFQRDAFRHNFLWRTGHCAVFYGIPFLLCMPIPWTSGIVVLAFATDCYFSRKAMKKFISTATQSLYRTMKRWRQINTVSRRDGMDYERWKMHTCTMLCNLKTLPLAFLSKRQQERYIVQLDDLLEQVNQINATEESVALVSDEIQQMLQTFTILPYYR